MDNLYQRNITRRGARKKAIAGAAAALELGRNTGLFKLISLCDDTDPEVRISAIKTLAQHRGNDAIQTIKHRINDSSAKVRTAACKALGELRVHQAKIQLYDALNDRDHMVSCTAAEALAFMGDNMGLNTVKKLIIQPGPHRWTALRTLNKLTGRDYPINENGLQKAIDWVSPPKKKFVLFSIR